MLMRVLLLLSLLGCAGCAELAKLAAGPSPSFVAVKSYSISLDQVGQTEIRFQAPVLSDQQIDEKENVISYKAKSRNGVKILIFAEEHGPVSEHNGCRAHHYAKSPEAVTKYVKAVSTETLAFEQYHAELSILQPRINLGRNKHFATAHAYFLYGQRCYNFHVIKALQSERDKKLVSSIVQSIAYDEVLDD